MSCVLLISRTSGKLRKETVDSTRRRSRRGIYTWICKEQKNKRIERFLSNSLLLLHWWWFSIAIRWLCGIDVLQDPRDKLGDARTDAGQVGLCTPDAPRDDAGQEVVTVIRFDLQSRSRQRYRERERRRGKKRQVDANKYKWSLAVVVVPFFYYQGSVLHVFLCIVEERSKINGNTNCTGANLLTALVHPSWWPTNLTLSVHHHYRSISGGRCDWWWFPGACV